MFKKLLSKSEFTKNVLTVLTGTALAQAIPILISPILTRLFSVEDFGIFFLFSSILAILLPIATAKYELTIILPERDEDAINIVGLVCMIAVGVSIVLSGVIIMFKDSIQSALDDNSSGTWLYLLPLTLLLSGVYQAFNYWANRKKRFKEISIGKIGQASMTGASNLAIGKLSASGLGLIGSTIAGLTVNTLVLFRSLLRNDKEQIQNIKVEHIRTQAKRYRAFPKKMVLANLFNIAAMQLPNVIMASMFGSAFLGLYAISQRVIKLPLTVISNAYGEVFKQEAAEKYSKGENIKPLFWKSVLLLAGISAPFFVVLYFFAPEIFAFVFGQDWYFAGEYASMLTPYFFLAFVTAPLTHLFYILERTGTYLLVQLILLSLVLGGLYYGNQIGSDPVRVVKVLTLSYGAIYLLMITILAVLPAKR